MLEVICTTGLKWPCLGHISVTGFVLRFAERLSLSITLNVTPPWQQDFGVKPSGLEIPTASPCTQMSMFLHEKGQALVNLSIV